ncbi:MAG: MATE family efflux transporter, partial [Clostridia bacterium]|nr:MATE family efflux transporter [Clostridia bacterium]
VAPLGTIAIAANSFGVTAESLCYMPGYGIASAAATLIGQSIGAGRKDLARRLGVLTTCLGIAVMSVSGALMYAFAPVMIGIMSPDPAVVELGARVLRIEAFAEPMFAASIVAAGVFRGAGDTLMPSIFNFASMWGVRLPMAALLAPKLGLVGVWIAMFSDLTVGGILFLIRLRGGKWLRASDK